MLGGYTSMRYNSVRDSEGQIMRGVCGDIQTEPTLLPINKNYVASHVQNAMKLFSVIYVKSGCTLNAQT